MYLLLCIYEVFSEVTSCFVFFLIIIEDNEKQLYTFFNSLLNIIIIVVDSLLNIMHAYIHTNMKVDNNRQQ